jgi:lipoprotein-anchoring transpeptidase ErfK/SrfK
MNTVTKAACLAVISLAFGLIFQIEPVHAAKNSGFFGSFGEWLATPPEGSKKKRNKRRTKNNKRTPYQAGSRYDYRSYRDANGNIDWNAYARTRVSRNEALSTGTTGQTVSYRGKHEAGSVVISTNERRLYLVLPGGKARVYKVGVGRPGFEWYGSHRISRKTEWPDWRPPEEMRQRQPYLPEFMPGGPGNPMGARALYLGTTLYRIHGTTEDHTIGYAVSSGCIRMLNQDVIDLYTRVTVGTKVYVVA